MYLLLVLSMAAVLGLIPAYIAKEKGYSFGLWWLYGWMLFIVAIIHAVCLPRDMNETRGHPLFPILPRQQDRGQTSWANIKSCWMRVRSQRKNIKG